MLPGVRVQFKSLEEWQEARKYRWQACCPSFCIGLVIFFILLMAGIDQHSRLADFQGGFCNITSQTAEHKCPDYGKELIFTSDVSFLTFDQRKSCRSLKLKGSPCAAGTTSSDCEDGRGSFRCGLEAKEAMLRVGTHACYMGTDSHCKAEEFRQDEDSKASFFVILGALVLTGCTALGCLMFLKMSDALDRERQRLQEEQQLEGIQGLAEESPQPLGKIEAKSLTKEPSDTE
mmetsp:Transcript_9555/g.17100  ORF Transcript_9555/g.17100 Transcript_9555/m.17100 type:complete len:232 (+) Transcript_9555:76-771(+)